MDNLTISIFGNKIFSEILNELKLFSRYKIKFYDNLNLCIKDTNRRNHLVIFFITKENKEKCQKVEKNNFPLIIITKSSILQNTLLGEFTEQLNMPFSIFDL